MVAGGSGVVVGGSVEVVVRAGVVGGAARGVGVGGRGKHAVPAVRATSARAGAVSARVQPHAPRALDGRRSPPPHETQAVTDS